MIQKRNTGILAILGVVTISGIAYISKAMIVEFLNPIVVVALQLLIMTVVLTGYNIFNKASFAIARKDIFMIVLSGLFGTTLFNLFSIMSIRYIGATVSSLLFGFAAVFSLIIEFAFYKRKITKLSIFSVIVSLVGVYILMGLTASDLTNTNIMGYFLSLLSIFSWVMYCFLSDKISSRYEKTVVLNHQALFGAITTLPFLFFYPITVSELLVPSIGINLLILGVLNAAVAYLLCIYAIKQIGVTFSNLLMNFFPVVTIIVSFLLYGTIPGINQILGGTIILVSVIILNQDHQQTENSDQSTYLNSGLTK